MQWSREETEGAGSAEEETEGTEEETEGAEEETEGTEEELENTAKGTTRRHGDHGGGNWVGY